MTNLKKKKYFILILIFFFVLTVVIFPKPQLRNTIISFLDYFIHENTKQKIKKMVYGKDHLEKMKYWSGRSYNEKIFPQIQFEKLKIKSFDVDPLIIKETFAHYNNKGLKTAFVEEYENQIMLITHYGDIKIINNHNIENVLDFTSNLDDNIKIAGSTRDENNLYLTVYNLKFVGDADKICSVMTVQKSKINKIEKKLNFSTIFQADQCINGGGELGGELALDKKNNKLYLSTGAAEERYQMLAQDDKSIYGKIIEINLNNNEYIIYSKGHRNPLGLLSKDNFLISAEHGPYGGDEINKIEKNKNYGWPISSYGEKYGFLKSTDHKNQKKAFDYKKNHLELGFKEPIFSFVPSIGINKIIEIPNNFSELMNNNYFLTSLNRNSIFRLKFDDNYNKLLFYEEISVGARVRDIAYIYADNSFVLYLEDARRIMVIESIN